MEVGVIEGESDVRHASQCLVEFIYEFLESLLKLSSAVGSTRIIYCI